MTTLNSQRSTLKLSCRGSRVSCVSYAERPGARASRPLGEQRCKADAHPNVERLAAVGRVTAVLAGGVARAPSLAIPVHLKRPALA